VRKRDNATTTANVDTAAEDAIATAKLATRKSGGLEDAGEENLLPTIPGSHCRV
jgi:hypothetical protein